MDIIYEYINNNKTTTQNYYNHEMASISIAQV